MFKKIYCYASPDNMTGHVFRDDVAICKAKNKAKAMEIFSAMYRQVNSDNVKRVKFNSCGVFVATNY